MDLQNLDTYQVVGLTLILLGAIALFLKWFGLINATATEIGLLFTNGALLAGALERYRNHQQKDGT